MQYDSPVKPDSQQIAVTGGSGFIGTHLVSSLLEQGYKVKALVRNPDKFHLKHTHLELIYGDLHDTHNLNRLVESCHHVIHCAGRVRGVNAQEFDHDNVAGTDNLINACSRISIPPNFTLISSLAAREKSLSFYSHSKYSAEILLKDSNIPQWSIIRPPAIYGPQDKELIAVFNWMKRGILWVPGDQNQHFSMLHVHDLVNLILQILKSPINHEILEPDDGNEYTWNSVATICGDYFKRDIRIIQIPRFALNSAAKLNVISSKIFGYPPMLTPGKVRELLHKNWVSSKIESDYHWTAKVDLNQGLTTLYSR